jgi:hypothetical protein
VNILAGFVFPGWFLELILEYSNLVVAVFSRITSPPCRASRIQNRVRETVKTAW